MASPPHFDDEFDFEGGVSARDSGNDKRSSPGYDDDDYDNDPFAPKKKKTNSKAEEAAPGVTTGMILSLRESLQNCQDKLAKSQNDLETAKSEVQKWHSSFQNEPFIPSETALEPKFVIKYLRGLKSSEETFREQLEKAKKKEAAFIVTFAKREQEIAELKSAVRDLKAQLKPPSMQIVKHMRLELNPAFQLPTLFGFMSRRLLLDPAIHEEFTRLKSLVEEKDKKLKELQDNISAVSFTPHSKMGKLLMAKCRTLQEENEEIGNQASEGKMHELAMKLAMQKSLNAELKRQYEGLEKYMVLLTNDLERSNETGIALQTIIAQKDQEIQRLKHELQQKVLMEDEKTDAASKKKDSDEVMSGEAIN